MIHTSQRVPIDMPKGTRTRVYLHCQCRPNTTSVVTGRVRAPDSFHAQSPHVRPGTNTPWRLSFDIWLSQVGHPDYFYTQLSQVGQGTSASWPLPYPVIVDRARHQRTLAPTICSCHRCGKTQVHPNCHHTQLSQVGQDTSTPWLLPYPVVVGRARHQHTLAPTICSCHR